MKVNNIINEGKIFEHEEMVARGAVNASDYIMEMLADVIIFTIANLSGAKQEINTFLGGLVGLSHQQFGKLPLRDILKILKQFKEQPDLLSFFQFAGDLTQKS
jgi:hypothetical protein